MSFSVVDHALMARALQLAARGACTTRPNPMVGCVIARGETVLGAGWHERAGAPHAEAHALREAGGTARGATAYVTLEPCAHHGRTPPCADALIAAGIARVVAACGDPFEHVDGAGVARLRSAGVVVEIGLMEAEARALNRGFFSRLVRGRPWLRVKLAMSLDGRTALADRQSQWITGEAARRDVAAYRARAGAIVTGIGTVLADNPRLTVRLAESAGESEGKANGKAEGKREREREEDGAFEPPLRVVLDPRARMPITARLLHEGEAPLLWLTLGDADIPGDLPPHVEHGTVAAAGDGRMALDAVMHLLAQRGINEVQVEAGPALSGALLRAGLVDELLLYIAPVLLGAAARPLFDGVDVATMAARLALTLRETRHVGNDLRLTLTPDARTP